MGEYELSSYSFTSDLRGHTLRSGVLEWVVEAAEDVMGSRTSSPSDSESELAEDESVKKTGIE